jgi:hypothetical protein
MRPSEWLELSDEEKLFYAGSLQVEAEDQERRNKEAEQKAKRNAK